MRLMPVAILVGVLSACARLPMAPPETRLGVDLEELSAVQARDRMIEGSLTSRALTSAYLERIAKIDDAGPMLNAVIEVSATALAEAERLDAERRAGKIRGPLHGIPVLIKDNIDVAGMVNSAAPGDWENISL